MADLSDNHVSNLLTQVIPHAKHDGALGDVTVSARVLVSLIEEVQRNRSQPVAQNEDGESFKHCDDYIHDFQAPKELRWFLLVNRMPALDQMLARSMRVEPVLYADFEGKTFRVTMASRLGDVGISSDLRRETGYDKRVPVADLSNFRSTP